MFNADKTLHDNNRFCAWHERFRVVEGRKIRRAPPRIRCSGRIQCVTVGIVEARQKQVKKSKVFVFDNLPDLLEEKK